MIYLAAILPQGADRGGRPQVRSQLSRSWAQPENHGHFGAVLSLSRKGVPSVAVQTRTWSQFDDLSCRPGFRHVVPTRPFGFVVLVQPFFGEPAPPAPFIHGGLFPPHVPIAPPPIIPPCHHPRNQVPTRESVKYLSTGGVLVSLGTGALG